MAIIKAFMFLDIDTHSVGAEKEMVLCSVGCCEYLFTYPFLSLSSSSRDTRRLVCYANGGNIMLISR